MLSEIDCVILVVPNVSLVNQMYSDFVDYGWYTASKHVEKLYSGQKPTFGKDVLITTFQSLMQAGQFVQVIEERQGLKIGCIEEIAYRNGFINAEQLKQIAQPLVKSGYGTYLMNLIKK